MKKAFFLIMVLLTGAVFTACNVTTANLSDIKMCEQLDGKLCAADQIVFTTNAAELYLSCKLNNAPAETKVKFSWFFLGEEKVFIDEVALTTDGSQTQYELHSSLSKPNNGWPAGNYEVIITIDANEASSITKLFSIQ
ncbi:MAG: hypothetical protein Q7J34_02490 [Bacteroidales bacterium]|nr:hypothetical protein [Bacteroidales bacterium]